MRAPTPVLFFSARSMVPFTFVIHAERAHIYEIVFKITYDNFYCDLSRRFPSFMKYFWYNYDNDIIARAVIESN